LYVKECRSIFEFDVTSKQTRLIGTTNDAVLAMHACVKKLREADLDLNEEEKDDLEEQTSAYLLVTVDDVETLSVFDSQKVQPSGRPFLSSKIKALDGIPQKLKTKDLFGLGYPYFVCSYANHLAFSTDYGICVI
jgi:hypothetical protein